MLQILSLCVCVDSLSRSEVISRQAKVARMKQSYAKQNICFVSSASVCLCNTYLALLHSPSQSSVSETEAEIQHKFIHRISLLDLNLWNFLTLSPTRQHFGFLLIFFFFCVCVFGLTTHSLIHRLGTLRARPSQLQVTEKITLLCHNV